MKYVFAASAHAFHHSSHSPSSHFHLSSFLLPRRAILLAGNLTHYGYVPSGTGEERGANTHADVRACVLHVCVACVCFMWSYIHVTLTVSLPLSPPSLSVTVSCFLSFFLSFSFSFPLSFSLSLSFLSPGQRPSPASPPRQGRR